MPGDRQIILTTLGNHGVRLQELNQGQRRTTYIAPQASPVDQGFCVGFSLDWLRKAILGGNSTYTPKVHKTEDQRWQTEQRQTLRAATVHLRKTEYRGADVANYNIDRDANTELYDLYTWVHNTYNGSLNFTAVQVGPNKMAELRQYFVLDSNTISLPLFLDIRNQLAALFQQKQTALQQRQAELSRMADFPVSWQAFIQAMDDYVDQVRVQENKEGNATRRFTALSVTTSSAPIHYATPTTLVNAIIADPGMVDGRGSVFGMDIRVNGNLSGHAVALYRSTPGNFMFMDPNYGIYTMNTNGLRNAVQYLFGTVYNSGGWVVPGDGNYAIFQRAV